MTRKERMHCKAQLAQVCRRAIAEYLETAQGASLFGHGAEIQSTFSAAHFQVRAPTNAGPEYFSVKITSE